MDDMKGIIIWAVFIAVCAAIILVSRRIKKQIDENGIQTTGVVTRIVDEGGAEDIDIRHYVRYRTQEGEEVEGILSNPTRDLVVGQQVILKYHPKYKQNARLVM